ncbi:MAG: hypothetical protein IJW55_07780, partial [Clostridia bacterium]|nr:hypothetical protein [Clostridia bacterium]
ILVSDRAPLLQSPLGAPPLLPPAKAFYLTRYFYFYFFRLTSLTKLQIVWELYTIFIVCGKNRMALA